LVVMNSTRVASCLLHGGVFSPEDGGDVFLRKVGWLSAVYMALYCRRQNSRDAFPNVQVITFRVRTLYGVKCRYDWEWSKDVEEVVVAFINVLSQYF
jgi:hypothetical protein